MEMNEVKRKSLFVKTLCSCDRQNAKMDIVTVKMINTVGLTNCLVGQGKNSEKFKYFFQVSISFPIFSRISELEFP